MGNGGKGGSTTLGYRYYMTLQMGLCRGPVDEIVRIEVGALNAWPNADGSQAYYTISEGPGGVGIQQNKDGTFAQVGGGAINTARVNGTYYINAPELFGGDKKEGGIAGPLDVYMGGPNQSYSSALKSLIGGLVPDFRGIASMVFDGLVTSLNPYPKAWKVRVRRVLQGWDGPVWQPSLAVIWMRDGTIKAMNPAHIIYECLTNRVWGRGYARTRIDEDAFSAAAQTLFDENFGLCLRWNRQSELGDFINEVIDHIGGYLRIDRSTGKIELGLMRGDYNPSTIPLFTYNSGLLMIEEGDTASQEDLVNEVVVEFRDPIANVDKQGRVQNLASKQSTEGTNSTKRAYFGIPTADLALRVAQRDLKVNASALKRYRVVLDRRAWRIQPGSVFRVQAPDLGIGNVVLRAGKVQEGGWRDGKITVEAVVDVFGLPTSSFAAVQETSWSQPNRTPVAASRRLIREATYHDLVRRLTPADLNIVEATSGTTATAVGRPTVMSQGYSISSKTTSEDDFKIRNSGNFVPTAQLAEVVGLHEISIQINNGADLDLIELNGQIQIGNEIMQVTAVTLNPDGVSGTMTVVRGTVDTVPQSHAVGATVFFVSDDASTDGREYTQGEVVQTKILPFTSLATLADTSADSLTITARQNRPWPPGNVRINGTRFGETGTVAGNMVLTWAHRNRLTIKDQFVAHGEGSVPVEGGVQYEIKVFDGTGATTPVRTVSVAADTWTYTTAMMTTDGVGSTVVFEIRSVRGSVFSQFNYRFSVAK